ncbi:DUF6946 family protein [Bradyrhizobium sp. RDM4]|uniref:DUF6946 family protein n=1 Tax=Bradyrhizobium sp. RDM4 TaxID=3378765 RepID=UPI0038FCE991
MRKIYVPTLGPRSWQALLADPVKHWRPGYSAQAIAHCWEASDGLPTEIATLFGGNAELLIAIPEHKVSLGDAGTESQTDVFALVKSNNRTIAVAVEGKVNESFGPTIRDWYVDPSPAKQQYSEHRHFVQQSCRHPFRAYSSQDLHSRETHL